MFDMVKLELTGVNWGEVVSPSLESHPTAGGLDPWACTGGVAACM